MITGILLVLLVICLIIISSMKKEIRTLNIRYLDVCVSKEKQAKLVIKTLDNEFVEYFSAKKKLMGDSGYIFSATEQADVRKREIINQKNHFVITNGIIVPVVNIQGIEVVNED